MTTLEQLRAEAEALRSQLVAVRRDLHAHPELGFEEVRTAGIVARRLGELGFEVQTGVGKTGVVAVMDGAAIGAAIGAEAGQDCHVLMLRFDMDALPMSELNDVPYRSQEDGRMHACGHDAHTAIGLGVAELLARHRGDWRGTAKFIFQPAEETVAGALAMIKDGVLEFRAPDRFLSLHVDSQHPIGTLYVTDGPIMAASDKFTAVVQGRGAHGAYPHQGTDPIVAAAQVISALQSIVSRNVDPLEQAVVTVGYIRGGTAMNIIPDTVEFGGTMRSFRDEIALMLRERVRSIVENVARAMGAEATVKFPERYNPATVNDPAVSRLVRSVAGELVGTHNVHDDYRMMGAEDAAYFLQAMPGCYALVGAGNRDKGITAAHHNAHFDIDEDALSIAATLATASALRILNNQ